MTIQKQALRLSKSEKLKLMEALWDDLSKNPNDFEAPGWHRGELERTEQQIAEGKARFVDWSEAKARLRSG